MPDCAHLVLAVSSTDMAYGVAHPVGVCALMGESESIFGDCEDGSITLYMGSSNCTGTSMAGSAYVALASAGGITYSLNLNNCAQDACAYFYSRDEEDSESNDQDCMLDDELDTNVMGLCSTFEVPDMTYSVRNGPNCGEMSVWYNADSCSGTPTHTEIMNSSCVICDVPEGVAGFSSAPGKFKGLLSAGLMAILTVSLNMF